MQAVHIGVRGQDDLVVAQLVHLFLDVEAAHQVVQLVVLVDRSSLEVADVQRFAFQREDRLRIGVATADDRPSGRLPLGDEDHRVVLRRAPAAAMPLAVLELGNANRGRARLLAGQFLDRLQLLA